MNLLTVYNCSDNKASNKNSGVLKSIVDEHLLNKLLDRYLTKISIKAKDLDSTASISQIGLDSSARMESFSVFWLKKIHELRTSDSLDYILYDSLFKIKLMEHSIHRRFPDSIRFFKTQLTILKNKLDSSKLGLFGNPVLRQFENLSNEKGNIYFLSAKLNSEDGSSLDVHFGIEELEQDTIISWTTEKSLAKYVWTAVFRRNSVFWTRGLKKGDNKEKPLIKEKTSITAVNFVHITTWG